MGVDGERMVLDHW